jgi:YcxB-like protein
VIVFRVPGSVPDYADLLRLRFTLKKSDIYRASYSNVARGPALLFLIIVCLALGFISRDQGLKGWIGAAALGFALFLILPYWNARVTFKNPDVLAPMTLAFGTDGLAAEFEHGTNSAAWALVKGATETKPFIFIKMLRGTFHLVPKSQLTREELATLRQILEEHVLRKVRLFRAV